VDTLISETFAARLLPVERCDDSGCEVCWPTGGADDVEPPPATDHYGFAAIARSLADATEARWQAALGQASLRPGGDEWSAEYTAAWAARHHARQEWRSARRHWLRARQHAIRHSNGALADWLERSSWLRAEIKRRKAAYLGRGR
jgi:hypothetical protein